MKKKPSKSMRNGYQYRYVMWAAPSNPAWLGWVFRKNLEKDKDNAPFPEAVYPIVDNDTCGIIDGEPRPDQYFCICFDADSQRKVFNALNGIK